VSKFKEADALGSKGWREGIQTESGNGKQHRRRAKEDRRRKKESINQKTKCPENGAHGPQKQEWKGLRKLNMASEFWRGFRIKKKRAKGI